MPALPAIMRPGSNSSRKPSPPTSSCTSLRIVARERRRRLIVAIGDAETAAEIDEVDGEAFGAQIGDQFVQQRERIA